MQKHQKKKLAGLLIFIFSISALLVIVEPNVRWFYAVVWVSLGVWLLISSFHVVGLLLIACSIVLVVLGFRKSGWPWAVVFAIGVMLFLMGGIYGINLIDFGSFE